MLSSATCGHHPLDRTGAGPPIWIVGVSGAVRRSRRWKVEPVGGRQLGGVPWEPRGRQPAGVGIDRSGSRWIRAGVDSDRKGMHNGHRSARRWRSAMTHPRRSALQQLRIRVRSRSDPSPTAVSNRGDMDQRVVGHQRDRQMHAHQYRHRLGGLALLQDVEVGE